MIEQCCHRRIAVPLYLIAEFILFISYTERDAAFHWLTHYFVGGIAALILMTVYAIIAQHSSRVPLLWLFLGHLFAMFPDILFALFHIAHSAWMNVFLFHLSAHYLPGRTVAWYMLFMTAMGVHLKTLTVQDRK